MAKEDTRDFGPAVAALSEHLKADDKGNLSATRSEYFDFMAKGGLNKETITKIHSRHEEMWGAMIEVGGQHLVTRIEQAKQAGDDPNDLKQLVTVAVPGGQDVIEIKARTVSPNPRHAEHGGPEKIVNLGATQLKVRRKASLPAGPLATVRAAVAAVIGDAE